MLPDPKPFYTAISLGRKYPSSLLIDPLLDEQPEKQAEKTIKSVGPLHADYVEKTIKSVGPLHADYVEKTIKSVGPLHADYMEKLCSVLKDVSHNGRHPGPPQTVTSCGYECEQMSRV